MEGREGGKGLKARRARTNRVSDLRRECLRTYPACINKEAAERTEIRVTTAHGEKEREHNVERVSARVVFVQRSPSDPSLVCACLFLHSSPKRSQQKPFLCPPLSHPAPMLTPSPQHASSSPPSHLSETNTDLKTHICLTAS